VIDTHIVNLLEKHFRLFFLTVKFSDLMRKNEFKLECSRCLAWTLIYSVSFGFAKYHQSAGY